MRRSRTVPLSDVLPATSEENPVMNFDGDGDNSLEGNESLISMPLDQTFDPPTAAASQLKREKPTPTPAPSSTNQQRSASVGDLPVLTEQTSSSSPNQPLNSAHGRSSSLISMHSVGTNTSFSIEELKKSLRKPNDPSPTPSSFSRSSKSSRLTIGRSSNLAGGRTVLTKNFDPNVSLLSLGTDYASSSATPSILPDLFSLEQALEEREEDEIKEELEALYAARKDQVQGLGTSQLSLTKSPSASKQSVPAIGWKTEFEVDAPKTPARPSITGQLARDSSLYDSPESRGLTGEQDAWAGIDALLDSKNSMDDSFSGLSTTDILPKSVVRGIRRQNSTSSIGGSNDQDTIASSTIESTGTSLGFTEKLANVTKRVSDESKRELNAKPSGKKIGDVFQWSNKDNVDSQHNPNRKLNARKNKSLAMIQSSQPAPNNNSDACGGGDDQSLPSLASVWSEDISTISQQGEDTIIGETPNFTSDRETFTIDVEAFKRLYSKPDQSDEGKDAPEVSSKVDAKRKSKHKGSNIHHSRSASVAEHKEKASKPNGKSSSSKRRTKKKKRSAKPLETMPKLSEDGDDSEELEGTASLPLHPPNPFRASPKSDSILNQHTDTDTFEMVSKSDEESEYEKASVDEESRYETASVDDDESQYETASADDDEEFHSPRSNLSSDDSFLSPNSSGDYVENDERGREKRAFLLDDEDQPKLNLDPKVDEYIKQAQQKLPAFRRKHKKGTEVEDDDTHSRDDLVPVDEEENPLDQLPSLTSLSSSQTASSDTTSTPTKSRESLIARNAKKRASLRKEEKKEARVSLGVRIKSMFSPGKKDKKASVASRGDEKYFPKEIIEEANGLSSNKCLLLQGDDGVNWD